MIFQYEEANSIKCKTGVELAFVLSYLENMNSSNRSFCTLSTDDGSYIQCAGAKLRLIIEYRKINQSGFAHYVLGKKSEDQRENSINYSGGIIRLKRNEILSIKDAKLIFQSFYEKKEIPREYVLRDVTDRFSS